MYVVAYLYAYPPDRLAGADLMAAVLLRALAARGHEVLVYTMQRATSREDVGVSVRPVGGRTFPRPERADVVYLHPDLSGVPYAYAGALSVPVVSVVHNTAQRMQLALRQRHSALVVWNSEATRTLLRGSGGIVCRPPLDIAAHRVERDPRVADSVTLVNLNAEKGALLFWDMAAAEPGRRFLGVVGAHGAQVTAHPRLGSLPNVDVVGPLHPTRMGPAVWARTRVLVAPSSIESWGMAAVEALCSGIPVVAHPTPGLQESLGAAGTFVDRANLPGWQQAVAALWDAPPEPYRARAAEVARQSAEDVATFCVAVEEVAATHRARARAAAAVPG